MTGDSRRRNGAGSKGENSSPLHPAPRPPASFACSLFPVPCSLFPVPCSLFPVPCSLFPVPCSLRMSKSENKCYKILRAVINAQHNTGQYFAGGN
ncbi:hypothetical protein FJR09_18170 [Dolichospermum sp. UHCC 0406]|nr:hypothetical protein [Dolichospermum sp. UHCC 0406]